MPLLATRFQQVLPTHVLVVLALLVLVALVLALVRHEKRLATALVERDQEVGAVITVSEVNLCVSQLLLRRFHLCADGDQMNCRVKGELILLPLWGQTMEI